MQPLISHVDRAVKRTKQFTNKLGLGSNSFDSVSSCLINELTVNTTLVSLIKKAVLV